MLANNDYREAQRQKTLRRQAAMAKPGEPITYRFGDDVVVLTKQPMEWGYTYEDGTQGSPAFKSKYKVELNGEHRAWIVAVNGWGAEWVTVRLDGKPQSYYTGYRNVVDKFSPRKDVSARDKLAERIPQLYREGRIGTLEEQSKWAAEEAARKEAREQEEARRREQWKRERAEERRQEIATLDDRLQTLRALLDRQVLTNYEAEVIGQIISEIDRRLSEARSRE